MNVRHTTEPLKNSSPHRRIEVNWKNDCAILSLR